jgi:hypothetical protein
MRFNWLVSKRNPLRAWTVIAEDSMDIANGAPALPSTEPRKVDDLMSPSSDAMSPLVDIEKAREKKPLPANPTGDPEPAKPISLKNLMSLLESSAKSLLDAGVDFEKSYASVSKVLTMGTQTESDRSIVSKAEKFSSKLEGLKSQAEALAKEIREYRSDLSGAEGESGDSKWTV